MSRATRRRVKQVHKWLEDNFVTPYPVKVTWVKKVHAEENEPPAVIKSGHYGECVWESPYVLIRLSSTQCDRVELAIDTLLHEWAHAMVMANARVWSSLEKRGELEAHSNEFWLAYGKLYRAWYDEEGCEFCGD